MLVKSNYCVHLEKTYYKILQFSISFSQTFCFLSMYSYKDQVFIHCNKQGKILFEYICQSPISTFEMLKINECIFLEPKLNKIKIINLETYEITQQIHQHLRLQRYLSILHIFSETKLFCIEQKGEYNDHRYKLSYYKYPNIKQQQQIVFLKNFECFNHKWTYEYKSMKCNNYSMICWFKHRQDQQFIFRIYEIHLKGTQQYQGQYKQYRFENNLSILYNITSKIHCCLCALWQMKKNKFLMICLTDRQNSNLLQSHCNDNYIYQNGQLHESAFIFPINDQPYLIDYINLGHIGMFRTFHFENGKSLPSSIYYINNRNEQILAYDVWQCTSLSSYMMPGWANGRILEQNQYNNSNVHTIHVIKNILLNQKEITVFFIEQIISEFQEQFDQDLIYDTIQCIDWQI